MTRAEAIIHLENLCGWFKEESEIYQAMKMAINSLKGIEDFKAEMIEKEKFYGKKM